MRGPLLELQAKLLVLVLLGLLIFGTSPWRVAALSLLVGIAVGVLWLDRRSRFKVGDRVTIELGPHRGRVGEVVALLHDGRGARVAIEAADPSDALDFPGGYELKRLPKMPVPPQTSPPGSPALP